jgi:membrane fusion protein (multidrug efflux system)
MMTDNDVTSAALPAALPDGEASPSAKRKTMLTRLAFVVVVIAALWGAWYYFTQAGLVKTDNAYVNAETAQVTALVAGAVREVRVLDTQAVHKGDIVLVLDDADARVDVATAEAGLRQARQRFAQAQASGSSLGAQVTASSSDIAQAEGKLAAARADFERARQAMARRDALAGTGAVSGEDASNARAQLASASAGLDLARAGVATATANRQAAIGQLAVNRVITLGTSADNDPDVAAARARLDAARLGLERTVVRAPVAGIVTQRQVQVGQRVAPGAPVMQIVPVDAAYVDANLKEGQLRHVRLGQKVELTSDLYGSSVEFHGEVVGLGGGTGAAFALIPAQNATGNWVKVVQRLPVRIAIAPADLKAHPLRVGLSMEAVIDTRAQ